MDISIIWGRTKISRGCTWILRSGNSLFINLCTYIKENISSSIFNYLNPKPKTLRWCCWIVLNLWAHSSTALHYRWTDCEILLTIHHLKKYLKTHQLSIGDHLYKVAAKVPQPTLGLTNKNDQIHIMFLIRVRYCTKAEDSIVLIHFEGFKGERIT